MVKKIDELTALRMSISAHFAALVSALEQQSPGVKGDFVRELHMRYQEAKDQGIDNIPLLESLSWTSELLKSR